jgi:chromosome condensin MukBEF MukE localization factor
MRIVLPKNQEEYDEYCKLAEDQKLIKVLRVTANPDAEKDWKLYARPEFKSRLLGHPERSD